MFALAVALLLSSNTSLDVEVLSDLAAKRDVTALSGLLAGESGKISPFEVMKGGAYDTGRFGWKALNLTSLDGKDLVVFDTQLTSEDTGDLVFERSGGRLKYVPEDDDLGILIVNHAFDFRFAVSDKTATLVDDVTFRRHGKAGPAFFVRFSPQYRVTSVTGAAGEVPFRQTAGVVSLPTPVGDGDFHLTFHYEAVSNLPGFAGSIGAHEAALTNDYWYPMIARQPATYSISIHSPPTWIGVGQGELVSTDIGPTERVTRYRMDLPVTYFSVSSAPYKTHSETINGRRYSVWSMHMDSQKMKDQCALYAPIIEFYDGHLAKFPFSGYGAVVSDVYGFGALEAYSFATYGNVPDEDGHEPSHTWFGGIINNSYLHSFWNESFADYCDGLYHRESPVGNAEARRLAFVTPLGYNANWERGNVEDSGVGAGSVASSLGYGKGAYVLSMLEQELGQETMLRCMRQWLADQPKDRTGEWQDFEAAVAKVTGKDFQWFWDQWLRRPGVADFAITDVHFEDGAVSGSVKFNGKPYRMKCDVLLQTRSARKYETFTIDGDGSFSLPSKLKPSIVSFDPWGKLLRKYLRDEEPRTIDGFASDKIYRDPKQPEFRSKLKGNLATFPSNLNGVTLVGSPETMPQLKPLCAKVGLVVKGGKASYRGTTVDLREGTASAIVDLDGGGHCLITMGASRWNPKLGKASVGLADVLGRFLDGRTDPKTSGFLTFRVP